MEEVVNTDAELEAKADSISVEEENPKEKAEEIQFEIPLSREYDFNGEKISSVDLSGLKKLTTLDAQEIDKVMQAMRWNPTNKFRDTLYLKHVAMRATGLPVEFFNGLSWKDMNDIAARETIYFLFR